MTSVRAASCALLLALVAAPNDTPRFAPAERSSLVKTLTSELVLTARSPVMEIDGTRVPSERKPPPPGHEQTQTQRIVFHDRWLRVDAGRPLELDRTFQELVRNTRTRVLGADGSVDAKAPAEEHAFESVLEEATIRFAWDPATAAYGTSAAAGHDLPVEALAGLREDGDLRALLPPGDVAIGDEWTIGPSALWTLPNLLGDLRFHPAGKADASPAASKLDLGEDVKGEARARYASVREVEGHRLATIAVAAKLTAERTPPGRKGDSVTVTWEFDGKLVWDLTSRHVQAFHCAGTMQMETSLESSFDKDGKSHVVRTISSADARFDFTLETREP